jgi:hypothetical protein
LKLKKIKIFFEAPNRLTMSDEAKGKRPLDDANDVAAKVNSGFKSAFKSSSKKQRRFRKTEEDDNDDEPARTRKGNNGRATQEGLASKSEKKPEERRQQPTSKSFDKRRINLQKNGGDGDTTMMIEKKVTGASLPQKNQQQQRVQQQQQQRSQPKGNGASQRPREANSSSTNKPHKNDTSYDSDGSDFDRQFYLADEGGYVVDSSEMQAQGQLGRFLFVNDKTKQREAEMEERRRNPNYRGGKAATQTQQRFNARKSALQDDQDAWEENRLLSSGAASRGEISLDVSTDNDTRVTLLVHQLKPPFLEKSSVGLGKQSTAATVKDNSSDFCKMAREGSVTLLRLRQEKDKNTMRQKFWELGGSKMGNAMRVKKEDDPQDDQQPDNAVSSSDGKGGEVDYKKSTGYASHMSKQKQEAASEFAKTKSIRQQREFLPIYSVRDELLSVIRENNVVVSWVS